MDGAAAAADLAAGRPVVVELRRRPVELGADEVELRVRAQAGFAVSRDGAEVVALDLALDDDLRRRGLAREVIRNVQELRKAAGLEVSDWIHLHLVGLDDLAPLFETIAREVLARSVVTAPPTASRRRDRRRARRRGNVPPGDGLGRARRDAPPGRRPADRHGPASGTCWPSTSAPAGPRWPWWPRPGRIVAHAAEPVALHLLAGEGRNRTPTNGGRPSVRPPAGPWPAAGVPPAVVGVGCTSQWSGTVAVGPTAAPLMRAVIWMDSRGNEAIRGVAGGPVNVLGYDPRKLLRWVQVTGGAPGLSGKDPVAHILFIRDAFPESTGTPSPSSSRSTTSTSADRAHLRLVRLHRRPLGDRQPGRSTGWSTTTGCSR